MSGLNLLIVSYDVCDDKRLRRVYAKMKEFGMRVHYSVFRCDLTKQGKIEMIAELDRIINHAEDRVMIIDLGPVSGFSEDRIVFLGTMPEEDSRESVIV